MQNMVKTIISMAAFHCQKILWLLNYANLTPVARTGTDGAWVVFGNAETGRTESHPFNDLPQSFGQSHCVFGGFQQMKGKSKCGTLTDPR